MTTFANQRRLTFRTTFANQRRLTFRRLTFRTTYANQRRLNSVFPEADVRRRQTACGTLRELYAECSGEEYDLLQPSKGY